MSSPEHIYIPIGNRPVDLEKIKPAANQLVSDMQCHFDAGSSSSNAARRYDDGCHVSRPLCLLHALSWLSMPMRLLHVGICCKLINWLCLWIDEVKRLESKLTNLTTSAIGNTCQLETLKKENAEYLEVIMRRGKLIQVPAVTSLCNYCIYKLYIQRIYKLLFQTRLTRIHAQWSIDNNTW